MFTARQRLRLNKLHVLVESFPLGDPHDPALFEKLQLIRAKFKGLVSVFQLASSFLKQGEDDSDNAETKQMPKHLQGDLSF